ncbi:NAD(P)/FAD-dependent oxidoreductase [Caldalkalibacillus salinus]|uniref:NAD(P)/FAD-dependent oxidoreductase n=1 Tax=Caldalkalibacillus salinus TaxID=2803787 RepID=UPI001921ABD7|nr:FAD-dependent oxidoreductase [Caldalkalibacillus salinus]
MTQYIIIGAGILGASTAYHLAKQGVQVTIVDRHDHGQATDAAAGIICPWLTQRRNKAWYRLVKSGAKYYPDLIKELEAIGLTDTGYQRVGAICLHTDEDKLNKMEERAYKRREDAPEIGEISRLSSEEVQAMFPPLSDVYRAVHISGAARVNGKRLRDSLLHAATRMGAKLINYADASLVVKKDQVTGVRVGSDRLDADKVIVTAGVWAKALLEPLGIELQVSSQKAQIVHLQLPDTDTSQWPVVMPPNNQYMLTFEKGRVVVGATHEDDVGYDLRVTAGGMHEILDKALNVAPGLVQSTVLETKVGFRPFTPGFLPIMGVVPGFDHLFVANGLGASGLTSGPFLGAELARLALGEKTELNLQDYDPREAFADKTRS